MTSSTVRIGVIGAGSWGTALAWLLGEQGHAVTLWVYEPELLEAIRQGRDNPVYLPGVRLPSAVTPTGSLAEAVRADMLLFAVPSHVARPVLTQLASHLTGPLPIVVATKGLEAETGLLILQMAEEVLAAAPPQAGGPHTDLAVLSGPSFAKEVCASHPTAVILAARDQALATRLQAILVTPLFKVLTSTDVVGVQLGGALKNIMAIAAGGVEGLGFGHNTKATLISRGLAEMTRLGVAMGADPATFAGLSGLGDLVLTCTGGPSRNRHVGVELGRGRRLDEILQGMRMVAEGINTTRSALRLAHTHGVRMPIVEQVYHVLFEEKDPRQAMTELLETAVGEETGRRG